MEFLHATFFYGTPPFRKNREFRLFLQQNRGSHLSESEVYQAIIGDFHLFILRHEFRTIFMIHHHEK